MLQNRSLGQRTNTSGSFEKVSVSCISHSCVMMSADDAWLCHDASRVMMSADDARLCRASAVWYVVADHWSTVDNGHVVHQLSAVSITVCQLSASHVSHQRHCVSCQHHMLATSVMCQLSAISVTVFQQSVPVCRLSASLCVSSKRHMSASSCVSTTCQPSAVSHHVLLLEPEPASVGLRLLLLLLEPLREQPSLELLHLLRVSQYPVALSATKTSLSRSERNENISHVLSATKTSLSRSERNENISITF